MSILVPESKLADIATHIVEQLLSHKTHSIFSVKAHPLSKQYATYVM